jgi:hypothetical protein
MNWLHHHNLAPEETLTTYAVPRYVSLHFSQHGKDRLLVMSVCVHLTTPECTDGFS